MEAAHRLDLPAVGTEAHYWQQSYIEYMTQPEIEPRTGKPKHFEQVAFERWLDANPNVHAAVDTIDVYMARCMRDGGYLDRSAPSRVQRIRVDSGDLAELGEWCLRFFEANGIYDLRPNLTGIWMSKKCAGLSETFPCRRLWHWYQTLERSSRRRGVIFKQCLLEGRPTLKRQTRRRRRRCLVRLQLFRGIDANGDYVGDVTGLDDEQIEIPGAARVERLLIPFWENGQHARIPAIEN